MKKLHYLAKYCNFEITLEAIIRYHFVSGACDKSLQRRVVYYQKKNISFVKTEEFCLAHQVVDISLSMLKKSHASSRTKKRTIVTIIYKKVTSMCVLDVKEDIFLQTNIL